MDIAYMEQERYGSGGMDFLEDLEMSILQRASAV